MVYQYTFRFFSKYYCLNATVDSSFVACFIGIVSHITPKTIEQTNVIATAVHDKLTPTEISLYLSIITYIISLNITIINIPMLVKASFQSVEGSLEDIRLFHTDRGNEFKNQTIEELLETFHIERSLSHKGCPYDNAVAEATFKIIKTEFVWNETFTDLSELKLKLWDYVHWYNHHRIHSSLGYEAPVQYRQNNLKKVV